MRIKTWLILFAAPAVLFWTASIHADIVGRVNTLAIITGPTSGGSLFKFTLDACSNPGSTEYWFVSSVNYPADQTYAFKALLAAKISGRKITLSSITVCPSSATEVAASAVRIINDPVFSPDGTTLTSSLTSGAYGTVSNLKVSAGVVYFRVSSCSGSDPYFKFTSSQLPGAFSMLLAALTTGRMVEVSGSSCPTAATGDVELKTVVVLILPIPRTITLL